MLLAGVLQQSVLLLCAGLLSVDKDLNNVFGPLPVYY